MRMRGVAASYLAGLSVAGDRSPRHDAVCDKQRAAGGGGGDVKNDSVLLASCTGVTTTNQLRNIHQQAVPQPHTVKRSLPHTHRLLTLTAAAAMTTSISTLTLMPMYGDSGSGDCILISYFLTVYASGSPPPRN